jgi:hypothetical protein
LLAYVPAIHVFLLQYLPDANARRKARHFDVTSVERSWARHQIARYSAAWA